jgi:hypothetical protein
MDNCGIVWLDDREKESLMETLTDDYASGLLDEGIYDSLITLNKINGLASYSSCAGHHDPATGIQSNAVLWVKTTETVGAFLEDEVIPKVLSREFVESVSKIFMFMEPKGEGSKNLVRGVHIFYDFNCEKFRLPDMIKVIIYEYEEASKALIKNI